MNTTTSKLIGNPELIPSGIKTLLRETAKAMDCQFLIEKPEYTSHYVDIVCQIKKIGGYSSTNHLDFNEGETYHCIQYTAGMNHITKVVYMKTILLLHAVKNN